MITLNDDLLVKMTSKSSKMTTALQKLIVSHILKQQLLYYIVEKGYI